MIQNRPLDNDIEFLLPWQTLATLDVKVIESHVMMGDVSQDVYSAFDTTNLPDYSRIMEILLII